MSETNIKWGTDTEWEIDPEWKDNTSSEADYQWESNTKWGTNSYLEADTDAEFGSESKSNSYWEANTQSETDIQSEVNSTVTTEDILDSKVNNWPLPIATSLYYHYPYAEHFDYRTSITSSLMKKLHLLPREIRYRIYSFVILSWPPTLEWTKTYHASGEPCLARTLNPAPFGLRLPSDYDFHMVTGRSNPRLHHSGLLDFLDGIQWENLEQFVIALAAVDGRSYNGKYQLSDRLPGQTCYLDDFVEWLYSSVVYRVESGIPPRVLAPEDFLSVIPPMKIKPTPQHLVWTKIPIRLYSKIQYLALDFPFDSTKPSFKNFGRLCSSVVSGLPNLKSIILCIGYNARTLERILRETSRGKRWIADCRRMCRGKRLEFCLATFEYPQPSDSERERVKDMLLDLIKDPELSRVCDGQDEGDEMTYGVSELFGSVKLVE